MLLGDRYARIRVEHPFHSSESRCSTSVGCSRELMKSAGNLSRLWTRVSQDLALGRSTTALPTRLISTSSPANRNSFGSRTAWLSPFLKSFAVFTDRASDLIQCNEIIYTNSIYRRLIRSKRRLPAELAGRYRSPTPIASASHGYGCASGSRLNGDEQ